MSERLLIIVEEELLAMMARKLDNAPSADDLTAVIQVMVKDLISRGITSDEEIRLRDAFSIVGSHARRWPTVSQVIEALPTKSQNNLEVLPVADDIKERRQKKGKEEIKKMRESLVRACQP